MIDFYIQCSWCDRWQMPDGSFAESLVLPGAMRAGTIKVSHTACQDCHAQLRLEGELNDPHVNCIGG